MKYRMWLACAALASVAPVIAFAQQGGGGQGGPMESGPAASFSQLDTDGNGMLDQKEYAEFQDQRWQFDFGSADTNHDGNLTREEWQAGLRAKVAPPGAKGGGK